MSLSNNEYSRYARHISLEEFGVLGQEKLKETSVLIVGAGGLGCPVLQYLTAAGIGNIGVVDGDIIEVSNLQRQILFSEYDLGKSKAEVAVDKLRVLNSFINYDVHRTFLAKENVLDIISKYDIVVDGSDNFSCRYLVNDACVIQNKPFVSGALYKFQGQLSVCNYKGGTTYRCLFPEPPPPDEVPNCSKVGVIGVVPGVIGSLMANEVIKISTDIGEVLSGKLMTIDLLKNSTNIYAFEKNIKYTQITELGDYDYDICDFNKIKSITPLELLQNKDKDDFYIMDVRESHEYDICAIEGSHLVPLSEFQNRISEIPKNKKIIAVCHYGIRSRYALEILFQEGFSTLTNLDGGIDAWAKNVDNTMQRY